MVLSDFITMINVSNGAINTDDVRINTDSRQRARQTASMAVGAHSNPVEVSHEVSKNNTDKRTEENEQLRVIISATNRKFIGVASLSYETPPGLEEASQRYRLVVGGAPPKIPSSWFEFPKVSSKNETSSVAALLGLPMDSDGEQLLRTSAETLSSTIEDMNIPVNPQDLIVEWSVASSLHMNR